MMSRCQTMKYFWSNHGKRIDWFKPYTKIKDVVYSKNEVSIKWYFDGTTNVSYNCIDRHAKKLSKQNCNNLGGR